MEQNAKYLETLQEAFRGSIDPEVVDLIFTETNYVVEDALEKLFTISKSDSSSDILNTDSENKSTKQNGASTIEDNHYGPTDRNTPKKDKKAYKPSPFKDDKSNSLAFPLSSKGPGYSEADSSSAITLRDVLLDSSEQLSHSTKEAIEPKEPSSFTYNHHSNNSTSTKHSGQSGIEVTDKPLSCNELPPWPDDNHGYSMPHIQSFPGQPYNAPQGFHRSIPHNFQGQRFTGDAGYFHNMPQYQSQQNMGAYLPRSPLQVPGFRYQPAGMHPAQNRFYMKRKEFQPHFGMRKPREFYQTEQKYANQARSEEIFLPSGKVLVILRGLPGSGKTTLAQKLKRNGIILSTDDFFIRNGMYQYEVNDLSEAHEWNKKRAKDSMQRGVSPIIIDNTNSQAWEMRPYISMGQRFGYQMIIKEPDTPWKWNTKELFKRNQHNVTLLRIQNMKERYEKDLTVESILTRFNFKVDKTHEHNSECIKPTSVTPKETSCDKQPSDDNSQELSSASENDEDVSNSGITVHSQSENMTNKQVKSSVESPHKLSHISQVSNQSTKQSKKKSEDFFRQEMETLRSHGSRSPIQDMDFSLSELSLEDQSLEIDDSFDKKGNFDTMITILPKPQRTIKRRERTSKSLEKIQNSDEDKENLNEVLDSKQAKFNLCENECESGHVIRSVEEKENGENNAQTFITGGENNEVHLKDDQIEQDIFSFGKKDVASDLAENKIAISQKKVMGNTGFSYSTIPLTTDESMNVNKIRREFGSESYSAEKVLKNQSENGKKMSAREEDYLLAKTKDCDESFKNTKTLPGFLNGAEKTETEKESLLKNVKKDLDESDLHVSGFQFLNTCFPDVDIQILVDVLAESQGDVTKAVENILSCEDKSSEVKSRKENTPNIDSSGNISLQMTSLERKSACSEPVQNFKPLKSDKFEAESQTSLASHVAHDHGHFQMTLEPAVAIHLLELFGPIDNISSEGDFSSNDLTVEVDSDFAKLLYKQWRTTIQNNTTEKLFHTEKQTKVSRKGNKEDSAKRLKQIHGKQSRATIEQHKATDLRQIMDEQMAVEQIRQEQVQTDESMAVVLKRKKLYAMFPGVDPLALDELFEVNRFELQPTVCMVETSCNLQAKRQTEFQENQGNSNSGFLDVDHQTSRCGEPVPETEFQALQDPDYEDFRAEANTHYKLRDECFRKAAFAFSKKQGQLAQFYASQGHMHTEKIRQANKRAAARILEHKNSNSDETSLDLHGLHVDEALLALEERLLFADSTKNYGPGYLSVITGKGIHSKQGKAKIKPAVLEYLERNNYRVIDVQPGLVRVSIPR